MYIGSFDLNMKNVDPAAGSYKTPKNTRAADKARNERDPGTLYQIVLNWGTK